MLLVLMPEPHYDLHTHSTASDGTLTPSELVRRACAQGVDVLALTDHDSVEGIAEAQRAARLLDLKLMAGAEVSVTWRGRTVHIVGLNVDPVSAVLQDGLTRQREFREWRAREMARRLARHGIMGAYEGALALVDGGIVSRTHFARYIVAQGRAKSLRDVFKRFLVSGKPGHVPGEWASLEEAVAWIRGAGGQAVVAHPARYKLSASKLRALFGEFQECGGVGIEVVSGCHSPDDARSMAVHARSCGLLASAGSDYHGPENPCVELGGLPSLPGDCVPIWASWQD